jgi:diguanylate cyclase (GGDEF)-like protein/PAS domain S-box-containing protein
MKKRTTSAASSADLRRKAETKLSARRKKTSPSFPTEADTQRLLHELQVHQIELEMQNEELVRARAEAEEAYRKYTDLNDFAPSGYFTLTREGIIHEVNLAGANLLGVERANLINRHLGLFASVQSRAAFRDFFEMLLSGVGTETYELAFLKKEKELIWVRTEATCFEGGQESRVVMVDVTKSKRAEENLLLQSAALDAAANAIVITDHEGTIEWVNRSFTSLTGYTSTEAVGRNLREMIKTDQQEAEIYKQLWKTILAGEVWHGQITNRRKDGSTYPEEQTITPLRNKSGKITHFIAVKWDITERKHAEEELRKMSIHDSLTGLYNRNFFMEEMARLERGRDFPVSIVMADVDGLKKINDQEGHAAGDILLNHAAEILTMAFRAGDVVARLGGDEFAVLLPATDAVVAKQLLQRMRQIIHDHQIDHPEIQLSLSLGVGTSTDPAPLADTLKIADANMYREKEGKYASRKDADGQNV